MRPDSVAQVLSLANVTAGDNILIAESCSGLVVGCVAERISGRGNIISLYTEQEAPVNNAFKCFNFCDSVEKTYLPIPFHHWEPLVNTSMDNFNSVLQPEASQDHESKSLEVTKADATPESQFPKNFPFTKCKRLDLYKRAREIIENPVDSLIIASKFEPGEVLFELFKYVRGSGHVVIFHPYLEVFISFFSYLFF